jgi:hypothetical protein
MEPGTRPAAVVRPHRRRPLEQSRKATTETHGGTDMKAK